MNILIIDQNKQIDRYSDEGETQKHKERDSERERREVINLFNFFLNFNLIAVVCE